MPYQLDRKVAGELGERTKLDTGVHPPIVHRLEYVLDYPGADDLIQSFPVYLARAHLAEALIAAGVQGITWREAMISQGDSYDEYSPAGEPDDYRWLVPGRPGDDCWLQDGELVVSDRVMEVLRASNLSECDIQPLG